VNDCAYGRLGDFAAKTFAEMFDAARLPERIGRDYWESVTA
jgi:hypothetical protein